jgi:hypothetical protein
MYLDENGVFADPRISVDVVEGVPMGVLAPSLKLVDTAGAPVVGLRAMAIIIMENSRRYANNYVPRDGYAHKTLLHPISEPSDSNGIARFSDDFAFSVSGSAGWFQLQYHIAGRAVPALSPYFSVATTVTEVRISTQPTYLRGTRMAPSGPGEHPDQTEKPDAVIQIRDTSGHAVAGKRVSVRVTNAAGENLADDSIHGSLARLNYDAVDSLSPARMDFDPLRNSGEDGFLMAPMTIEMFDYTSVCNLPTAMGGTGGPDPNTPSFLNTAFAEVCDLHIVFTVDGVDSAVSPAIDMSIKSIFAALGECAFLEMGLRTSPAQAGRT